ncbi:MAG: IS1 family transposase [Candidatus Brocadiaceae bacterium]|nr:IS1 family transposase [Candidatus Brocadiaceae bacterium]
MLKCPNCKAITKQSKYGFTKSHSQRYRCQHCQKSYTPEKKLRGYTEEIRKQAIQMYIDGVNFRRIGRFLGVHHQTVINWVNAYAEEVPSAPVPDEVDNVEMDELFTFIGSKKSKSTSSSS